jgi:HD-GYP domain-containing protein (c-di-GMP phosphodiesterase class II)
VTIKKKIIHTEKQLKARLEELAALFEIGKSIVSTLELPKLLDLVTKKATLILKTRGCSLRLLHGSGKELVLKSFYGPDKKSHLMKGNLKVGESIAGRVVKTGKTYIIPDLLKEKRYKYTESARREDLRSAISVPLIDKGMVIGALTTYSQFRNHFNQYHAKLLSMFASLATITISNARLYAQTRYNFMNAIKFLSQALDAKDRYTSGHCEKVAQISLKIADKLGLSQLQKEALEYASYLHDLGKVAVDHATLQKPGRLTQSEWEKLSHHPEVGAGIIDQVVPLRSLVPIILHHHARYEGGGYPDRSLKQERIPIGARVLAVADAYEAMVSERPYRQAKTKQEAVRELKRCAGSQFDPSVVQVLVKILGEEDYPPQN